MTLGDFVNTLYQACMKRYNWTIDQIDNQDFGKLIGLLFMDSNKEEKAEEPVLFVDQVLN